MPTGSITCYLGGGQERLLANVIAAADATAVNPTWGAHDDGGGPANMGHGTEMAGLAAYGDLVPVFASAGPIVIGHCVESVKILPPHGANKPELYGCYGAALLMVDTTD
jgi:hypothetical protein